MIITVGEARAGARGSGPVSEGDKAPAGVSDSSGDREVEAGRPGLGWSSGKTPWRRKRKELWVWIHLILLPPLLTLQ